MQQDKPTTTPSSEMTVEDRRTEFVPVEGGQDTTSAATLLILAYAFMWLLVFVFVYRTVGRQRRLERRLEDLERALSRADARASTGTPASSDR